MTGFVWAIVFLVLALRFGYQPLNNRLRGTLYNSFVNLFRNWNTKQTTPVFFIILFLAIAARIWNFGAIPAGFNQDGAMAAVDAKALADYGTDRFGMELPVHFTAWGYGQMSVLLSYLMVPFIKVAGLNEITARIPALAVSLCGLLALYGFIRDSFGRSTALIVFFLATINPWHIMQSRWALDCNIFPHFFIIGCYFLNRGRTEKYNLYLSMAAFALCMYSYGVAFVNVPLFLMAIAIYTLATKIFRLKEILLSICIYTLVAWPIWLVMVINFLKLPTIHALFVTLPFFPNSVRSNDILFFSPNYLAQLEINFSSLLNTVILQNPDAPWNALDSFGTQYLFSLPFVILGAGFALEKITRNHLSKDKNTNETAINFGCMIVISGLAIGLWTGFVIASVNVNRINIIYYFMIILAGIGLSQVFKWFKPAFIVSGIIYSVFFCLFCNYYFNVWPKEIGTYFFEGMGKALYQAAKIDTPKYYITVNSQYQGSRNVSEILTLFYHKIDARYFQGADFQPSNTTISSDTISGNTYGTPYVQRYNYVNPTDMTINPEEKAVYVVNSQEQIFFNPRYFDITDYNGFALIISRNLK
ncbi:MAG: hypothetical protein HOO93_11815 [Methyloglobulus sp.]|nr:hypothetical protein [Methyloglobulus sp.]